MYISMTPSARPPVNAGPWGLGAVRIPVPRLRRRRGLRGLGQDEFSQPGPNGGTQIVDANGNLIYSAAQVAADPGLLSALASSGVCPGGLLPTYFPGGESTCAGTETVAGGSNTPAAQFNYPVDGACPVAGWCFTGSSMTDPASYTWTGGGSPTSPNPALIFGAQPIPASYSTPASSAPSPAAVSAAPPLGSPTVVINSDPYPMGPPAVTLPVPLISTPPVQSAPAAAPAAALVTTGPSTSGNVNAAGTCFSALPFVGLPAGACFGPLDAGTWGLIGAGVLLLFVLGRK
jgi:hypothetical protein